MHDQARACQALLSSVVALAVNDATIAPLKRARNDKTSLPLSTPAYTAMRFLFDESVAGLKEYANWLDFDEGQFRTKLRKIMSDSSHNIIAGFDPMKRRNFRQNYGLWLQVQTGTAFVDDEEDNLQEE